MLLTEPWVTLGIEPRAAHFHSNPTRRDCSTTVYGFCFGKSQRSCIKETGVIVCNAQVLDLVLAQIGCKASEILSPIKIADDQDIRRIVAAKFVEVGKVVWVSAHRGYHEPRQQDRHGGPPAPY